MGQSCQNLDLGPRVGEWLRAAYPGSRAKNVSREFKVSESTAKRWLGGERPTPDVLAAMAQRWGWRFVHFTFERAVGTPAMYAEMQAMDVRVANLEAERKAENARGDLAIARNGATESDSGRGVVPEGEAQADPVAPAKGSGGAR